MKYIPYNTQIQRYKVYISPDEVFLLYLMSSANAIGNYRGIKIKNSEDFYIRIETNNSAMRWRIIKKVFGA